MFKKSIILALVICLSSLSFSYAENIETADSPFNDTEVKVEKKTSDLKIVDIEVAKAAGITDIQEGYPKEGVLSGLGASFLRLRSWPWGNVIGQYYQGTKVQILGTSGEFYLVEVNGQQGYMHKNYVTTS